MTFTKEQQHSIDNLRQIKNYYDTDPLGPADPERDVVINIIDFVLAKQTFTESDIRKIEELYNTIIMQDHHNGTGWFDFKLRLTHFLRQFFYGTNWDKRTGALTIAYNRNFK